MESTQGKVAVGGEATGVDRGVGQGGPWRSQDDLEILLGLAIRATEGF